MLHELRVMFALEIPLEPKRVQLAIDVLDGVNNPQVCIHHIGMTARARQRVWMRSTLRRRFGKRLLSKGWLGDVAMARSAYHRRSRRIDPTGHEVRIAVLKIAVAVGGCT